MRAGPAPHRPRTPNCVRSKPSRFVAESEEGQIEASVAGTGADASFLTSLEDRAAAGIADRQEQMTVLRRETKSLQAVKDLAASVKTDLESQRPGSALFAIERAKEATSYVEARHPDVHRRLMGLRDALIPQVDRVIAELPRSLPAALEEHGVPLDGSSRSPKFTVARSYVIAVVDPGGRRASVQTRTGKKERVPVDPDVLANHIKDLWARCFERETNLPDVARMLREAWAALARPEQPRVAMRPLLKELAARNKQFSIDEFAVDLARLVGSKAETVPEAAGLHLDHTKSDAEGLLLPGLEQQGYFGYVSFE